MESIEYIILCNMFFKNVLVVPKTDDSKQKIASPRPTEKKKKYVFKKRKLFY
jgi:hypothetical protein